MGVARVISEEDDRSESYVFECRHCRVELIQGADGGGNPGG